MTTNYREILRLESLGLNKTDIASAAQCARNTVSTTLARAKACGLRWPLPEGMSDKELEERLFPSAPGKVVYNIRVGNGTQYDRITAAKDGSTFDWVATAENGWHAVVVVSRVGWVSGKYAKLA